MISSHIYTFLSVTLLFIGWLFLFPLVKLLSIIVPDCSTVYLISSLLFRLILYPSVNLRFVRLNIGSDKFSPYGQKAIVEAKKNGTLVDFARNMPTLKKRKKLLAENVKAKNSDIWAKYIFREAFSLEGKDLGPEWAVFSSQFYSSRNS